MEINNQKKDDNYYLRQTAGISAGAAVALGPKVYFIKKSLVPLTDAAIEKRKIKISQKYPPIDTFENIKNHAEEIIDKTGLKEKKVRIYVWTPDVLKKREPLPSPKTILQRIKYTKTNNRLKIFANGLNACFIPNKRSKLNNYIVINNERLYSAVFHEIGHALNSNSNSNFAKLIVKARQLSAKSFATISLTCLAIGLFHNKKSSVKKKSKLQKTLDFIHDNAGKIVFLAFSPTIIEEGIASLRARKLIKPYYNAAKNELHTKNLTKALFTYVRVGLMSSCAVALGIFVKDKIVQKKKTN